MKNHLLLGLLVIATIPIFSTPAHGALAWSDEYKVSGVAPPPFDGGTIFPSPSGEGYALLASSQKQHASGTYSIPSFARFDNQGNTLWSHFLDAGASATEVELIGDFENSTRVFAGYFLDSGVARFGLFQGASGAAVYTRELALATTPEKSSLLFFPGSLAAVIEDLTSQVRVLLVNDSGNTVFGKTYGSPLFGVAPGGAPPLQFTQDETLTQLPDRTGYILSVHMSAQVFNIGPPIEFQYRNIIVTACLNNNGTVRWSKSFPLTTGTFALPILNVAADGSAIYAILGGSLDFISGQASRRTHLVKLNSNGSFAWATTLEDVQLAAINYGPNSVILLSGSRLTASSPESFDSDFVMARLNFNTGAVEAQAMLRGAGAINNGSIVGSRADRVYWVMQSGNSLQFTAQTGYIGYVTLNLNQPTAKQYNKTLSFGSGFYKASDQSVLYSPFVTSSASVGAIMMDQNLVPVKDCGLFANATVQLNNAALTTTALAPVLSDAALTVTDPVLAITPGTFAPSTLVLTRSGLCGGGGTNPTSPTLIIVRNPSGSLSITFSSQTGVNYAIQFTATLGQPFGTVQTLAGTGGTLVYEIPNSQQGPGFFRVLATASP